MSPAFRNTIVAPNFKIEEITLAANKTIPILNENIGGCPGGQNAWPCCSHNAASIFVATLHHSIYYRSVVGHAAADVQLALLLPQCNRPFCAATLQ